MTSTGFLTQVSKNTLLDYLATMCPYASIHTADPGATGANEATGGSPAYARLLVTWAAAGSGSVAVSALPTFDLPAGTYSWVGLWSAVTSGTFRGKLAITSQTLSGQGTIPIGAISWDLNVVADA
jgi:hypothetical protein